MTTSQDRGCGALLGLAIGDALGTTLEFCPRDSRPLLTEIVGGGPFNLPPGVWTDDTSMALCLADSLLHCERLDEDDIMRRFVVWWRTGANSPIGRCFDIGDTTRRALARFEAGGPAISPDRSPDCAGNGSLMRLAPIPLFYLNDAKANRAAARRQSATTHASAACLDACEWFADLLRRAIAGEPKSTLLLPAASPYAPPIAEIVSGAWRSKTRADIRSSGYVVVTLEAAVWAVAGASCFEDAVVTAANLGDDADTVAAVTGQLAGSIWGASAIPKRWLEILSWREIIHTTALALLERGKRRPAG